MSVYGVNTERVTGLDNIHLHSSAGTGSHFSLVSYVLQFVFIDHLRDLFSVLLHKRLYEMIIAVFQGKFALH